MLLALAIAAAYANSLSGPFVYDDLPSITHNSTIRQLWPLTEVLQPPGGGATVSGRPLLNLSFALNYATSGLNPRGYHLTNIGIHAAAALLLFGLVRRSILRSWSGPSPGAAAVPAGIVAGLWALHPLQTESVTYVVQRAESLMSAFYLLTLYAFARSTDSVRPIGWRALAWIGCVAGMATKENMVSAPLAVLLWDRAFFAGNFAVALRERWRFYVALLSTWVLLAALVLSTGGNRGGSAGLDVGVSFVGYALTQIPALAQYAWLSFWPHPLVFDYGAFFVRFTPAFLLQTGLVLTLLLGTAWALWRRPRLGFAAATALAILAPTSLVPGTTQMIVEHRLYLPLAAVASVALSFATLPQRRLFTSAGLALIAALGVVTAARNRVYASPLTLWSDTVAKRPENAVAHGSLGAALGEAGRPEEAAAAHRRALELNPNYTPSLGNLGMYLADRGSPDEGFRLIERANQLQPHSAMGQVFAGVSLRLLQRPDEALVRFARAIELNPLLPAAHYEYGDALAHSGRLAEAERALEAATRLDPGYAEAHLNLAGVRLRMGDTAGAQAAFETGARLRGDDPETHLRWANLLIGEGRAAEALAALDRARLRSPASPDVAYARGMALVALERLPDAVAAFREAVSLHPQFAEAHNNLANVLVSLDQLSEAVPHYERSLELRPGHAVTHNNLGLALARLGRMREALPHFEAAVRAEPAFAAARENAARARAETSAR